MRILVVDDSEIFRHAVRDLLEEYGHTVDFATDHLKVFELLRLWPYDYVFMDLELGQSLNGSDIVRMTRNLLQKSKFYILSCHSLSVIKEKISGIEHIFSGIIQKEDTAKEFERIFGSKTPKA